MVNYLHIVKTNPTQKSFLAFFAQTKGITGGTATIRELFRHDPIVTVLCDYHRDLTVDALHIQDIRKEDPLLEVRSYLPYVRGVSILLDVIQKRRLKKTRSEFATWRPRRSLGCYGLYGGQPHVVPISTAHATYLTPGGFSGETITLTKIAIGGPVVYHVTFDNLRRFARKLQNYVGQRFIVPNSLGRSGSGILSELYVTQDAIGIRWSDVRYNGYPGTQFMVAPYLDVQIYRNKGAKSGTISIFVDGIQFVSANAPNPGILSSWINHATDKPVQTPVLNPQQTMSLLGATRGAFNHSIMEYAPALYHTQCQALSKVMVDLGRNYENFMESPELIKFISDVTLVDPKFFKKNLGSATTHTESVLALRWLVLLISGGILIYNFALKPTYEAVVKAAEGVVVPLHGESEMRFENRTFASLPQGLKDLLISKIWILGVTEANIADVRLIFRSEIFSTPDYQSAAQVLLEAFAAIAWGAIPTPKGLWDTLTMSFVVDWFLNIGGLIKDAETYFASATLPFRAGHSVSIELHLDDGRIFADFLRSELTEQIIDPPMDSWMEATGVPLIAIPLAIVALIDPSLVNLAENFISKVT